MQSMQFMRASPSSTHRPSGRTSALPCAHKPLARFQRVPRPAAAAASEPVADATSPLIATCKEAAAQPGSVAPRQLLQSMVALEKAKLDPESWLEQLQDPQARWRLIYTAPAADVTAAVKGQAGKAGQYFPITAVQRFDAKAADFENGVFLGPLAHLTFNGPFAMSKRQLQFDVVKMNVGLGPLRFSIPFKSNPKTVEDMDSSDRKKLPFFLYIYVDQDIVVARGRSGGLALWARTQPDWEATSGVLAVYK